MNTNGRPADGPPAPTPHKWARDQFWSARRDDPAKAQRRDLAGCPTVAEPEAGSELKGSRLSGGSGKGITGKLGRWPRSLSSGSTGSPLELLLTGIQHLLDRISTGRAAANQVHPKAEQAR